MIYIPILIMVIFDDILHSLLAMTWYNPIFTFAVIICLWFIPGIVIRRYAEKRIMAAKAKKQEEKIKKLYPEHK